MGTAALLGNVVVAAAYAAISWIIVRGLWRSGQLGSNRLGTATATIFFTCSVGHAIHAEHIALGVSTSDIHLVVWDGFTACVALFYLSQRKSYGRLLQGPMMFDDSDRAEAERKVRASEQRYRALVDNLPDSIITIWSTELELEFIGGDVRGATPAASYVGRPLEAVVGHELPAVEAHYRAALAGERRSFESRGAGREFEVKLVPLLADDGAVESIMSVAQDVTERKAVERHKDEFFALVSHELRTPLTSISGYSEVLLEEGGDPLSTDQRHFVEVVRRNTRRLERLVGDLLFVAQLEAGRLALDRGEVALEAVVDQALESAGPHAHEMQVGLRADVTPARVEGDFDRLGQVVDNLLSNAIKFTPAGGSVTVRLAADDGHAVLEVRDSGIGIAPADLERLFSKFYRAETAATRAIPGLGLGLNICKAIVDGHGGAIEIDSAEGAGTCVRVTLPLAGVDSCAGTQSEPVRGATLAA